MNDIIAIILITAIFICVIITAIKSKSKNPPPEINLENSMTNKSSSIFGPFTLLIAILLFGWSIICFFGGPDAERGLRPIIYGIVFLVLSVLIGYKSVK